MHGTMKTFGLNFEVPVSGLIVSWIDNHALVRIDCRLYAVVLGNVADFKKQHRMIYLTYLRSKSKQPNIII